MNQQTDIPKFSLDERMEELLLEFVRQWVADHISYTEDQAHTWELLIGPDAKLTKWFFEEAVNDFVRMVYWVYVEREERRRPCLKAKKLFFVQLI
ncbi:MAG: hypothetical protein HYW90_04685 [Candidatus Sungbacteria bacterium]|nr:hypothetical protein [Candidatus Sungbacteria bacterium]